VVDVEVSAPVYNFCAQQTFYMSTALY